MEKTIDVNGKPVRFKATGATIRLYRQMFRADFLQDIQKLQTASAAEILNAETLVIFENIAYLMAKQADPAIPDTPDEWLDTFDMLDIYQVLPQITGLWGVSEQTLSESKKKALAQTDL